MINFFKGIIVGIGGIAPGLSGSILLVIFGLYKKTINAIGTLFKDFKNNVIFLVPLFLGFGVGVLLFSTLVDYLITTYEMYTRYAFLGLVLGTVPLFYKEVKQNGFNKKYYIAIAIAFIIGISLFVINKGLFPTITNPNILQSVVLGLAVAGSTIVPGIDSAVILSSLGLYEIYVSSIAHLNLPILIPAGFGLVIGAFAVSFFINKLLDKYYTITFSIIFGLFLAIIPRVLNETCYLGFNIQSLISILLLIAGFFISIALDYLKDNKELVKKITSRLNKSNQESEIED